MLKYFFKIIIRNATFHKSTTILKFLGLVLGITTSLIIFQYIIFENSYDTFHNNYKNIYRISRHRYNSPRDIGKDLGNTASLMIGPTLKEEFTEITEYVRLHPMYHESTIQIKNNSYNETRLYFSDASFFTIFNFKLIKGDQNKVLLNPDEVVLSESLARKYFGDEDPLGKHIKLFSRFNNDDYTVTGIFKDLPHNTHFEIDALFSIHRLLKFGLYSRQNPWKWGNFRTYIKTKNNVSIDDLYNQTKKIISKHDIDQQIEAYKINYTLTPVNKIHLDGKVSYREKHISALSLSIFIFIGILIVITTWFNYINLSVSGFFYNFKLFKIKSQLGVTSGQSAQLFIFENLIANTLAYIISLALILFLRHTILNKIGLNISLPLRTSAIFNLSGFLIISMITVISALTANIIFTKKNSNKSQNSVRFLIMQYLSAFVLFVVSLMAIKQINFLKKMDIGIQVNNIIAIKTPSILNNPNNTNDYQIFRDEVQKIPGVNAVSNSTYIPGQYIASIQSTGILGDTEKKFITRINYASHDYFNVYQNKLLAGRFHSIEEKIFQNVVINKSASRAYGFKNPEEAIGKTLHWYHTNRDSKIIGVVEDFNHESPDIPIYPLAIYKIENIRGYYSINLSSVNYDILNKIEKVFQKVHKGNPYEMQFVNQLYNNQYRHFDHQVKMFIFFTVIALLISLFGLISVVRLTIQQRIKEIGIRKVNGAKISEILTLLNNEYIKGIFVAISIGIPVSFMLIRKWTENFAEKTQLSWWIFVLSGCIILIISVITISIQCWYAAKQNPVDALRYE